MKKLVVLLTIVAVLVCSVLSVSAATAQEQVIDALKAIPAAANNGNVVEKTQVALKKVNPTDAQCAQIVTWLGELKTAVPTDKGPKASAYTAAEKQAVLDFIDKVAKLLGYKYEAKTSATGDMVLTVFNADGSTLLSYDAAIIQITGVNEFNTSYLYLAAGLVLLAAAGAFVVIRKKNA